MDDKTLEAEMAKEYKVGTEGERCRFTFIYDKSFELGFIACHSTFGYRQNVPAKEELQGVIEYYPTDKVPQVLIDAMFDPKRSPWRKMVGGVKFHKGPKTSSYYTPDMDHNIKYIMSLHKALRPITEMGPTYGASVVKFIEAGVDPLTALFFGELYYGNQPIVHNPGGWHGCIFQYPDSGTLKNFLNGVTPGIKADSSIYRKGGVSQSYAGVDSIFNEGTNIPFDAYIKNKYAKLINPSSEVKGRFATAHVNGLNFKVLVEIAKAEFAEIMGAPIQQVEDEEDEDR